MTKKKKSGARRSASKSSGDVRRMVKGGGSGVAVPSESVAQIDRYVCGRDVSDLGWTRADTEIRQGRAVPRVHALSPSDEGMDRAIKELAGWSFSAKVGRSVEDVERLLTPNQEWSNTFESEKKPGEGVCIGCERVISRDHYCFGCKQFICEACDQTKGAACGDHDPDLHLIDTDQPF